MAYLLPCPCGQKMLVETRQAGETVRCACGSALEVPTLGGMRALETAEPTRGGKSRPSWNLGKGLVLIGALTAAVGIVWLLLTAVSPPIRPEESIRSSVVDEQIKSLTAAGLVKYWDDVVLKQGLRPVASQETERYQEVLQMYRLVNIIGGVVLVAGLAMMTAGFVAGRQAASSGS